MRPQPQPVCVARRKLTSTALVVIALAASSPITSAAKTASGWRSTAAIKWPEATEVLRFDNAEGVILVQARVQGADVEALSPQPPSADGHRASADTAGWFAIDTGAGYLALDRGVSLFLGLMDSIPDRAVDVSRLPLGRLQVGGLTKDQIAPVLVFDARILSAITDHNVLGLIGYQVFSDRAIWIDYRDQRLAMIPAGADLQSQGGGDAGDAGVIADSRRALEGTLSRGARPVRFRMAGDGKVFVQARVTPLRGGSTTPWLTLLLDTGASKCTLFEDAMESQAQTRDWKPAITGLVAPTLLASSSARLCRARRIELRGAAGFPQAEGVDVALIRNPLASELERVAGEPVHGLLGYSFLERFRVVCDYPHQVLWLDPLPDYRGSRPYEHAHVGLQLERAPSAVRVVAVADGSPAALAGIQPGDELVSVDGAAVSEMRWAALGTRLEGPPGTRITLVLRRGDSERTYSLRRRRLL